MSFFQSFSAAILSPALLFVWVIAAIWLAIVALNDRVEQAERRKRRGLVIDHGLGFTAASATAVCRQSASSASCQADREDLQQAAALLDRVAERHKPPTSTPERSQP